MYHKEWANLGFLQLYRSLIKKKSGLQSFKHGEHSSVKKPELYIFRHVDYFSDFLVERFVLSVNDIN